DVCSSDLECRPPPGRGRKEIYRSWVTANRQPDSDTQPRLSLIMPSVPVGRQAAEAGEVFVPVPKPLGEDHPPPVAVADGVLVGDAVTTVQLDALLGDEAQPLPHHHRRGGQGPLAAGGIGAVD